VELGPAPTSSSPMNSWQITARTGEGVFGHVGMPGRQPTLSSKETAHFGKLLRTFASENPSETIAPAIALENNHQTLRLQPLERLRATGILLTLN